MIERPRAAIASRVALAMLGAFFVSACDSGAKPPKDAPLKLAPVIIVTKTEITYQGKVISTSEGKMVDGKMVVDGKELDAKLLAQLAGSGSPDPVVHVGCDAVAAMVPSVLFAYDPGYFAFAAKIRPKVQESCEKDAWPEALRRCIVTTSPDKLVHDHACEDLVSGELAEKVAKRFGVPVDSLPHATQSPTTIAP